jgi:hypothetical protein
MDPKSNWYDIHDFTEDPVTGLCESCSRPADLETHTDRSGADEGIEWVDLSWIDEWAYHTFRPIDGVKYWVEKNIGYPDESGEWVHSEEWIVSYKSNYIGRAETLEGGRLVLMRYLKDARRTSKV